MTEENYDLYELTRGHQTKYTDEIEKYDINKQISTLFLKEDNHTITVSHRRFTINMENYVNEKGLLYKNLRINVNPSLIKYISIEISGCRIDSLYYDIYEVLMNYFGVQNIPNSGYFYIPSSIIQSGFPVLRWHGIKLIIEFKEQEVPETLKLKFDLYKINGFVDGIDFDEIYGKEEGYTKDCKPIQFICKQLQYCGREECPDEDEYEEYEKSLSIHKYRLNYNHVSELIIVEYADKNASINEVQINHKISNNGKVYETKEKLYCKIGNFCVYKFKTFINFSRTDYSIILSPKCIKNIYMINHNIVQMLGGMAGLHFSK